MSDSSMSQPLSDEYLRVTRLLLELADMAQGAFAMLAGSEAVAAKGEMDQEVIATKLECRTSGLEQLKEIRKVIDRLANPPEGRAN